jgi:hypothetical protein
MNQVLWSNTGESPYSLRFGTREDWQQFLSAVSNCSVPLSEPEQFPCTGIFLCDESKIEAIEWLYITDFDHEDGYRRDWKCDGDAAPLWLVKSKETVKKILKSYEGCQTRWLVERGTFPYYIAVLIDPRPDSDNVEIDFIPIYKELLTDE